MSLLLEGLALERLAREAVLTIKHGIEPELRRIEMAWSGLDAQLAAELENPELAPCTLEPPVYWFVGHRKSMIDESPDRYPLITAMAYQLEPKIGEEELDQAYEGTATLFVEGIVKADSQGIVNRRAQRMTEAVNNVLVASLLNGVVSYVPFPSVLIADEVDVMEGRDSDGNFSDGTGRTWWWQGFRLQYRLPTVHTVAARQAGHVLPPDGIDTRMVPIG